VGEDKAGKRKLNKSVAEYLRKAEGNKYQKRKKNERKNKFDSNLIKKSFTV